jgi:hypothetical protein
LVADAVARLESRIIYQFDLRTEHLRAMAPLLHSVPVAQAVPRPSDVLASFRAMPGPRSPAFDSAYPVPFHLERDAGPRRYLLTNRGSERLDGVTLSLLGAGVMPATAPSVLAVGESLEVVIATRDLARSTVLLVRWFRPSGAEFLWRVSFCGG